MTLLRMLALFLLSGGILSGVSASNDDTQESCNDWLIKSVKLMESKPMKERVRIFLTRVSKACDKIPEKMIQAARRSIDADSEQRYRILQKASASYFPKSCSDYPSLEPAKYMKRVCLEDDYVDGVYSAALLSISSGEYLYGKALEKELKKISNIDSFYSRRIMLNYFLSVAILYEEWREL
ncbi:MAG TPA: hypothetical protein ENJ08_02515 [Gammaproteobacteria bacterium]|nr:hypothetical protein [Gammaproteobacteria bacterium]